MRTWCLPGKSEDLVPAREERGLGACEGRARTWCLRLTEGRARTWCLRGKIEDLVPASDGGKSEDLVPASDGGKSEDLVPAREERGLGACD